MTLTKAQIKIKQNRTIKGKISPSLSHEKKKDIKGGYRSYPTICLLYMS